MFLQPCTWPSPHNALAAACCAQVEKHEQQSPLLSASHVDYAVMYQRAQQVAELCGECGVVLAARVTRVHSHGLHASCPGAAAGCRKAACWLGRRRSLLLAVAEIICLVSTYMAGAGLWDGVASSAAISASSSFVSTLVSLVCLQCPAVHAMSCTSCKHTLLPGVRTAGVGDGFIPIGLLPKDLRSLFTEQVGHGRPGAALCSWLWALWWQAVQRMDRWYYASWQCKL